MQFAAPSAPLLFPSHTGTFASVVANALWPQAPPMCEEAGRLHDVFVSYFVHHAPHHEKALACSHLTLTISARRPCEDPSCVECTKSQPTVIAYNNVKSAGAAFAQQWIAVRHQLSDDSPAALDEAFFRAAQAYLGDKLCQDLKQLLKRVRVDFAASTYLVGGKVQWANWSWEGTEYAIGNAHTHQRPLSQSVPLPERPPLASLISPEAPVVTPAQPTATAGPATLSPVSQEGMGIQHSGTSWKLIGKKIGTRADRVISKLAGTK